ncbi:HD-GYP domain-containing protein [Limnoglobus roseus]|nr:HD domain-containing phosphohydrolase [Limnoglobus roseus]
MSDTRQLLARISSFRAKLEGVPRLLPAEADRPQQLAQSLQQLADTVPQTVAEAEPPRLTARAFRLLTEARELIDHQKKLTGDALLVNPAETDPLAKFHRGTVGLTDSALKLAQLFPAAAEAQLRMCDGFEHLLQVIRHRLSVLEHSLAVRRADAARVDQLSKWLTAMHLGNAVRAEGFLNLAEVILDEARQGGHMRFLSVDPLTDGVAKFVAAHAINVAQVLARLVPHDFEWAMKPTMPVAAALMMDVGMLDLSADLLTKAAPLTDGEKRMIESHARRSADILRAVLPEAGTMADLVVAHHERIDGTGYPNGFRADTIPSLARLLAVADVYAALRVDRPHRVALEPRAAMTEVMLMAEEGKLDRDFTEYMLHLSFHPIGTVIELTDGRIGIVVSTHNSRTNLRASMRPVVALLTNTMGDVLPRPEFLDLAATEVGSIVRALPAAERREKLGEWYPDLCS